MQPTELRQKVEYLAQGETPRQVQNGETRVASVASLEKALGIGHSTMQDYFKGKLGGKYDMPDAQQSRLAQFYKFDVLWPEWQTGSHMQFKERYQREHGQSLSAASARRLGLQLIGRRYGNNPWQLNDQLATIELVNAGAPVGEARVTARIIARATAVAWDEIYVKHLKIIIEPSDAGTSLTDIWENSPGAASTLETLEGRKVMLVRGGTSRRRSYTLQAVDPDDNVEIGELWLPRESKKEMWSVVRLAPGDRLTVTLSAFAKDLSFKGDTSRSFARTDGQPLGRNARKILEHLEKPVGKDGYSELCGDVLEFDEVEGE